MFPWRRKRPKEDYSPAMRTMLRFNKRERWRPQSISEKETPADQSKLLVERKPCTQITLFWIDHSGYKAISNRFTTLPDKHDHRSSKVGIQQLPTHPWSEFSLYTVFWTTIRFGNTTIKEKTGLLGKNVPSMSHFQCLPLEYPPGGGCCWK